MDDTSLAYPLTPGRGREITGDPVVNGKIYYVSFFPFFTDQEKLFPSYLVPDGRLRPDDL